MANLDSPALKLELTPEIAIGLVQKEVAKKGWKKYELSDIALVYVPFYVFSFDVIAEGGAPPGKAALNAHTGELNEFVPVLLERPFARQRKTAENAEAEVESTSVRESEVEKVATVKIANALGAKRENIVVSAVNKIYIPFYRVWVDVADDEFKIEIDGCLGAPAGAEAIPARAKTWDESASDTVKKMQSPSGLAQLLGSTAGEVGKLISGKSSGNKYLVWGVMVAVVVIVGYFALQQFNVQVNCQPHDEYLGSGEYFGLVGARKLIPLPGEGDTFEVRGKCTFNSREDGKVIIGNVVVSKDGIPFASSEVNATTISNSPVQREFVVSWPSAEGASGKFAISFEKIVG